MKPAHTSDMSPKFTLGERVLYEYGTGDRASHTNSW